MAIYHITRLAVLITADNSQRLQDIEAKLAQLERQHEAE